MASRGKTVTAGKSRSDKRFGRDLATLAVMPYFVAPDAVLNAEFAKGVTVRVTDTMKSIHDLRVISASSMLGLKRSLPIPAISQLVDADYVLKGQILRADQELHFKHRLYDGPTGNLITTVEVSFGLGDLHGFEREVLTRVAADVLLPLRESEVDRIMAKRAGNTTAYELTVKAEIALHCLTRRHFARAKRLLLEALAIDPRNAAANAWLARYYSLRIGQGWAKDHWAEGREALRFASMAIALDPEHGLALATAGHLNSYLHKNYVGGEALLRSAVQASPNEALAHLFLSATLAYTGRARLGREHAEYALSLSPLDRCIYTFYNFAAVCCYADGDYEAAVSYARQSLDCNANYSTTHKVLAASLVGLGRVREAREVVHALLAIEPGYPAIAAQTVPFKDARMRDLYLRQIRTAGCFDPIVAPKLKAKTL